jgi:nicotinate-nucleotide pyrophosphorylase (carboxylating)
MKIPRFRGVEILIENALREDFSTVGDVTTDSIFKDETGRFYLQAKQEGVLCGKEIFIRVFRTVDKSIEITFYYSDGDKLTKGDRIASVEGSIKSILKSERVALNFLSHLSGISTKTAQYVSQIRGRAVILDTRKTIPGLRALQKYAVLCGGGKNHRMGLYDMVMIKDNHIDGAGGISRAVKKVRENLKEEISIEVEVRNLQEVREAIECNVDYIMLDNMSLEEMRKAVKLIGGKAKVEASGNVTLNRIEEVSETGVDYISVGELTHSVKAFDFSLKKE